MLKEQEICKQQFSLIPSKLGKTSWICVAFPLILHTATPHPLNCHVNLSAVPIPTKIQRSVKNGTWLPKLAEGQKMAPLHCVKGETVTVRNTTKCR